MISVTDNFLPENIFLDLKNHVKQEFNKITVGDKEFLVIHTPENVLEYMEYHGYEMTLTFIRKAHSGFDDQWRIHADSKINGRVTDMAAVLYIDTSETENGTCFWKHDVYGYELPLSANDDEFDRMLLEDANNINKWKKTDFIQSRENRLLVYSANMFHSKYPKKIEKGERIVLVAFYSKVVC